MSPEIIERAVEPFFSTKGIGKGSGLGLSMAHGLAAQLGGTLTIHSTQGVGTTIDMWLPEAQGQDAAPEGKTERDATVPANGAVLLVDDEELVRTGIAAMLADLGFAVVEAASADEALAILDAGLKADLLVTDHLIPRMTGTELARNALARRPGMKAIIVSGYADVDDIAPDLPRLSKPFRQDEFAQMIAAQGPAAR
jgi:CheY-like chemotaxis protein